MSAVRQVNDSLERINELSRSIGASVVTAIDELRNAITILELADQVLTERLDEETREAIQASARRCRRALTALNLAAGVR